MRVCGIDCGTETTGYGVVEWDDRRPRDPRLVSLVLRRHLPAEKIRCSPNASPSSTPS